MTSSAYRRFWSLRGFPQLVFRLLVVGLLLSTGIGVAYALVNRPAFVSSFPGAAAPVVYGALLIVAGVGLIALVGLWRWRRWALGLYAILVLASIVLDVIVRAPLAHQLTVIVSAVVLFTLAFLNRSRFRNPEA